MRVVQVNSATLGRRVGIVEEDSVFDLTGRYPQFTTTNQLLEWSDESELRDRLFGLRGELDAPSWKYHAIRSRGSSVTLECPVSAPEVWGAGVTYHISRDARVEESAGRGAFYQDVFTADRPELFLKASGMRGVVPPGAAISVRGDSVSTVPEPELAAVVGRTGAVVGYVIADDVTARDIESVNPLYLPQAKIYDGCCSFGPELYLPAPDDDYRLWTVLLRIEDPQGGLEWEGETSISRLSRTVDELIYKLTAYNRVPCGSVLMTGTGLVPEPGFTLREGNVVTISIDALGAPLQNPVVRAAP